jgi:hypothetical protein
MDAKYVPIRMNGTYRIETLAQPLAVLADMTSNPRISEHAGLEHRLDTTTNNAILRAVRRTTRIITPISNDQISKNAGHRVTSNTAIYAYEVLDII